MLDLLQAREAQRRQSREWLREQVREELRRHLAELLPGVPVLVFGSLTQSGKFHAESDVDIAIESIPPSTTIYRLTSELMERMHRPVDVIELRESRLADKIRREGEPWMP
jgi:predicted nucleotidyltransferase